MMTTSDKRAGFTPGPVRVFNNPVSNYGFEIVCDAAIKSHRVICRLSGPDRASNAALIAEAFNVAHETGLTPRQLVEQRDELLAALLAALPHIERLAGYAPMTTGYAPTTNAAMGRALQARRDRDLMKAAIAKATGGALAANTSTEK